MNFIKSINKLYKVNVSYHRHRNPYEPNKDPATSDFLSIGRDPNFTTNKALIVKDRTYRCGCPLN